MPETRLDEFHWHEVLDRTHVVADTFDDHILLHPAIEQTPSLKMAADEVSRRMHDLYQAIGKIADAQSK
jgi:hypothetical protein